MPPLGANAPALSHALLQCFAVGLLIWILFPHLFMLFGGGPRRRIDGSGVDLAPGGQDPVYADLVGQLKALGFEPLGFYRESIPLGPRFCTAVFGSRRWNCFAGLYRLSVYDEPRLRFLSAFDDDAIVHTKNDQTVAEQRGDHLRQGVYTSRVEDVLRLHLEAVDRYRATGRKELPGGTLQNQLEVEDAFYRNRNLRVWMRGNFAGIVKTQVTLIGAITGMAWVTFGVHSPVPWIALSLACLGWKVLIDRGMRAEAHHPARPERPWEERGCLLCTWSEKLRGRFRRREESEGPPAPSSQAK